jgi:hypothetical protein
LLGRDTVLAVTGGAELRLLFDGFGVTGGSGDDKREREGKNDTMWSHASRSPRPWPRDSLAPPYRRDREPLRRPRSRLDRRVQHGGKDRRLSVVNNE